MLVNYQFRKITNINSVRLSCISCEHSIPQQGSGRYPACLDCQTKINLNTCAVALPITKNFGTELLFQPKSSANNDREYLIPVFLTRNKNLLQNINNNMSLSKQSFVFYMQKNNKKIYPLGSISCFSSSSSSNKYSTFSKRMRPPAMIFGKNTDIKIKENRNLNKGSANGNYKGSMPKILITKNNLEKGSMRPLTPSQVAKIKNIDYKHVELINLQNRIGYI